MPVKHLINNGLIVLKAEGEVVLKDFYVAWKNIQSDPEVQSPIDGLIDFREAHIDLSGDEIESAVSDLSTNRPFKKLAILAGRGSFTYVVGYMFCEKAKKHDFHCDIFISEQAAKAWLLDRTSKNPCRLSLE